MAYILHPNTTGSIPHPNFGFSTHYKSTVGIWTRGVAHEHTIEDCKTLQAQIEKLIQQGHLGCFIQGKDKEKPRERSSSRQHPNTSYHGTIATIFRGDTLGGRTASARKRHTRTILAIQGDPPRTKDPYVSVMRTIWVSLLNRTIPCRLQDRKGPNKLGELCQCSLLVDLPKIGTSYF
ncbi:hypothetical protein CR513_59627, partial [Mucuna pruriens]